MVVTIVIAKSAGTSGEVVRFQGYVQNRPADTDVKQGWLARYNGSPTCRVHVLDIEKGPDNCRRRRSTASPKQDYHLDFLPSRCSHFPDQRDWENEDDKISDYGDRDIAHEKLGLVEAVRVLSLGDICILRFPESCDRSADEGLETLDRKVSQGKRAYENLHASGDHRLDGEDTSNEQQQCSFSEKCRWTVNAAADVQPLRKLV